MAKFLGNSFRYAFLLLTLWKVETTDYFNIHQLLVLLFNFQTNFVRIVKYICSYFNIAWSFNCYFNNASCFEQCVNFYFYDYIPLRGFFYIVFLFTLDGTADDERMFIGLVSSLLNWEWHIIISYLNEFVFKFKIRTPEIAFVLF